jgi:U4/U6.U5 tri-snRNP component SNU23
MSKQGQRRTKNALRKASNYGTGGPSEVTISSAGLKPRKRPAVKDLPKPTETMKRREGELELDKNLNKTMVVTSIGGRGPGQPGFYCEVCNRNHKDSNSYLDHINSRARK